jgi:hypothetical protein
MSAGHGVRLVGKMQVHMPLTESVSEVFWICIPTKQAESIDVIPMKSSSLAKNRAQFTPMRTTAADSRTKLFITLETKRRPNPLFENRLLVVTKRPEHGPLVE